MGPKDRPLLSWFVSESVNVVPLPMDIIKGAWMYLRGIGHIRRSQLLGKVLVFFGLWGLGFRVLLMDNLIGPRGVVH